MKVDTGPAKWKILLAFAVIYFVWGSTFLAIRIGVHVVPPFLFAAMRFLAAGLALFGWTAARQEPLPARREWLSVIVVAFLIFVCDYGLLFWAEQRVPSGIAAVMMSTIAAFVALAEILILRARKLTLRLAVALLIGTGGVAVLVSRSLSVGGALIDPFGAVALVTAAMSFALGSTLTRKLPLPSSRVLSSGAQMLAGGFLLALASASMGELRGFRLASIPGSAWFALLYLIVLGSIVGFTAYVWLLQHQSPTKVATYAYVNPIVAVILGYFLGGEELGIRTVLGALLILVSVVLITTTPAKKATSA